jgi:competence protein ComFC
MWEELLNFIFPERCIGCDKPGSALCAICERTITTRATALSGTSAALFDYKNPLVKKAIWALKYKHRRSIGKYFGTALYREFFKQLSYGAKKTDESIVLIPVPASQKARRVRGYNHAGIIAATIASLGKAEGLNIILRDDILYKRKEVEQQARTQGKQERLKNVERLFAVAHGEDIYEKTVILIDDVITTGATIGEARRALKACKPKRVLAIAVAH